MKKKLLIVLTLFLSLFMLTACEEGNPLSGLVEDKTLEGTYKSTKFISSYGFTKDDTTMTLVIKDDKTAVMTIDGDKPQEYHFTYDDKKMTMEEYKEVVYDYTKKDKDLSLKYNGDEWKLKKE